MARNIRNSHTSGTNPVMAPGLVISSFLPVELRLVDRMIQFLTLFKIGLNMS